MHKFSNVGSLFKSKVTLWVKTKIHSLVTLFKNKAYWSLRRVRCCREWPRPFDIWHICCASGFSSSRCFGMKRGKRVIRLTQHPQHSGLPWIMFRQVQTGREGSFPRSLRPIVCEIEFEGLLRPQEFKLMFMENPQGELLQLPKKWAPCRFCCITPSSPTTLPS